MATTPATRTRRPHPSERAQFENLNPALLRVYAAVLAGDRTTDDIARTVDRAKSTVWEHLKHLRRIGLIDWVTGRSATIHPLYRPIEGVPCLNR